MPVIKINKRYLFRLLESGFDEKKLEEQVAKLGLEMEAADAQSISIEVTANRPDLLSAVGLARALRNFTHKAKKFSYAISEKEPALEIVVDRNVKNVRPYVAGVVAQGLRLDDDSLADLVTFTEKFCETYGRNRRRVAIGMHNMDAIRPPVRYRCESDIEYVPLGETRSMRLSQVLNTSRKGIEYAHLLRTGNREHYPVIEDSQGVASFVPILNSERTRVTMSTKNLFVDVTGTSEYAVNKAVEILGAMLLDLGADVRRVRIMYGKRSVDTPEMEQRSITLPLARAEREIGVRIGFDNVISLANKMGYEAALIAKNIRVTVPEYRLDVIDAQDIVEDLAIGYGYEYINPQAIISSQRGGLEERTRLNREAAELMVGMGFTEFANSYLTNEQTNYVKPCVDKKNDAIVLKNPKTLEIGMMRTWLLPSVLKNLGASAHDSMAQNAFELDMVFCVKSGSAVESYHLCAASVHPRSNFNEAKALVEGLLYKMGIKHELREFGHGSFIEGRCAEILIGEAHAGFFGELHPAVIKNFGIEEPGIAFEIDLEALAKKKIRED